MNEKRQGRNTLSGVDPPDMFRESTNYRAIVYAA